ncbi:MAG: hypothetical protein EOS85_15810 [Mesorhizobium sp.]|nr:MAG: hypothetical protein EOS85_15810 [Mesorhizobium sp.]
MPKMGEGTARQPLSIAMPMALLLFSQAPSSAASTLMGDPDDPKIDEYLEQYEVENRPVDLHCSYDYRMDLNKSSGTGHFTLRIDLGTGEIDSPDEKIYSSTAYVDETRIFTEGKLPTGYHFSMTIGRIDGGYHYEIASGDDVFYTRDGTCRPVKRAF